MAGAAKTRMLVMVDRDTLSILKKLGAVQGRGVAGIAGELLREMTPSLVSLTKLFEAAKESKQIAFQDLAEVLADARLRSAQAEKDLFKATGQKSRSKKRAAS